ncbi:MAG: polyphenol oxidase family protein [Actinomycetota bacterium]
MTDRGVAFTAPGDGDMRADLANRRRISQRLGISPEWAVVHQVHGTRVVHVREPGLAGEGDAIVTDRPGLPAAVFTADCLGVVLHAAGAVAVAHAGWRGLAEGVLEATVAALTQVSARPDTAHLGPAIGPCCFEVGEEVASRFPDDVATTTWGSPAVDLAGAARRRLGDLATTTDGRCTACGGGPSHRRDATTDRMAAIGWVP